MSYSSLLRSFRKLKCLLLFQSTGYEFGVITSGHGGPDPESRGLGDKPQEVGLEGKYFTETRSSIYNDHGGNSRLFLRDEDGITL